ncbi:MAG: hypothetical protein GY702_27180 [Desulfobulbaceae bacterium]|nr:hypothetical protein [Desulfobulbaceae bacterium]
MRIILLVVVFIGILFPSIAVSRHVVGFLTGSGGLGDDSFNDMTHMGLGR